MSEDAREHSSPLVEHYFRHEYGRLVATLSRVFGVRRLETVEDAVQSALMLALTSWPLQGTPHDPGGWLYRVAYNQIVDGLRRAGVHQRATAQIGQEEAEDEAPPPRFANEIRDDQLRMLFVCCEQTIPPESQLVLALKTLCGFSTSEIAQRLFTSEMNVRKRLARARERLRELAPDLKTPSEAFLHARLEIVRTTIYLLFNEGFHSRVPERAVRRELCDEAIRLATLLVEHPVGDEPASRALLALMFFHLARLASRVDGSGELLLLEEQDRSRWDQDAIRRGWHWLHRAAEGGTFSRYHAEAGIAAEHCLAPSFAETRWSEIADLYAMLEQLAPSPLHVLNRAIAIAQFRGPREGLRLLSQARPPEWLSSFYLWDAAIGELHRRAGDFELARTHLQRASDLAPTDHERALVQKRLRALGS